MRYAIISDIHSNLEAFEAVLLDCDREGITKFFCLGDIVGYGANPAECLERIKRLDVISVAGNHDWAVAGNIQPTNFNAVAKEAVVWTKENLKPEDIAYLSHLELFKEHDDFYLVHATLHEPEEFIYLNDITESRKTFALMNHQICFLGHTHVPVIFIEHNQDIKICDQHECPLEPNKKYIVNVGSVGQPRDKNPKASYGIYDADRATIQIKRVPYDIGRAQEKILKAGLPMSLAYRLALGY